MGFVKRDAGRWPNGEIPFILQGDFSSDGRGDDGAIVGFQAVMRTRTEYANKTAIRLRRKQPEDKDWVEVKSGLFGACLSMDLTDPLDNLIILLFIPYLGKVITSNYGRLGGAQLVNCNVTRAGNAGLNREAQIIRTQSSITHEFGHVIGLLHEHQRPDRDMNVTVDPIHDVINYGIKNSPQDLMIGAYDCSSNQHYANGVGPLRSFSSLPGRRGCAINRQRTLTKRDEASVNFLYPLLREGEFVLDKDFIFSEAYEWKEQSFSLWYNKADGNVVINQLEAKGWQNLWQGQWSKSISLIATFKQDGNPYAITYNLDGTIEIFRIMHTTSGVTVSKTFSLKREWQKKNSWTHFTSFSVYGTPMILAYSNISRQLHILQIMKDGKEYRTNWKSSSNWEPDWTDFQFFTRSIKRNDPWKNNVYFMISHKSSDRTLNLSILKYSIKVTPNGETHVLFDPDSLPFIPLRMSFGQFPWWTSIRTYQFNGMNFLVSYDDVSGFLQIWSLGLVNEDVPEQYLTDWNLIGETPWSKEKALDTFVPYVLAKEMRIVNYSSTIGHLEFCKVYATFLT